MTGHKASQNSHHNIGKIKTGQQNTSMRSKVLLCLTLAQHNHHLPRRVVNKCIGKLACGWKCFPLSLLPFSRSPDPGHLSHDQYVGNMVRPLFLLKVGLTRCSLIDRDQMTGSGLRFLSLAWLEEFLPKYGSTCWTKKLSNFNKTEGTY